MDNECVHKTKIRRALSYQQIELARVQAGVAVIFRSQLEQSESVLICSESTIRGLVEINEATFEEENVIIGSGESSGITRGVSFAGGFINISPGLRDPVVLQISPATAHRVAMHAGNVIMRSDHGTRQTFQHHTEST
jgi:hypothetical protein